VRAATTSTSRVERLAYTRKQAAEVLGVSVSTIDRRVVPPIDTVKARHLPERLEEPRV